MFRPPQSSGGASSSANGKEMVNAVLPYSHGQVVDQARGPDHRRYDEAHFALQMLQRLERRRVDQSEIIDPEEAGIDQRLFRRSQYSADRGAAPDCVAAGLESIGQGNCATALVVAQICIA